MTGKGSVIGKTIVDKNIDAIKEELDAALLAVSSQQSAVSSLIQYRIGYVASFLAV